MRDLSLYKPTSRFYSALHQCFECGVAQYPRCCGAGSTVSPFAMTGCARMARLSRWFVEESEMGRWTAMRGLFVLALCEIASGCAGVTPVAYSEVASSAYLAPNPSDSSGRMPYR